MENHPHNSHSGGARATAKGGGDWGARAAAAAYDVSSLPTECSPGNFEDFLELLWRKDSKYFMEAAAEEMKLGMAKPDEPIITHEMPKTQLCKAWQVSRFCRYGMKCTYAHGFEELRTVNEKMLRNRQCRKPKVDGLCLWAHKCEYQHSS